MPGVVVSEEISFDEHLQGDQMQISTRVPTTRRPTFLITRPPIL